MKKIIAFILCIGCLLVFCACGDDADEIAAKALDDFAAKVAAAEATGATAKIEYKVGDDKITIDVKTGETISVPAYQPITFDSKANAVLPATVTAEQKSAAALASGVSAISLNGITFNKEYFKDGNCTVDENGFKATVNKLSDFLGTTVSVESAEVSIKIENNVPTTLEIAYDTAAGAQVTITVTYNY